MVPLYREALERWERRDDAVLQETELGEAVASRKGTASLLEASEGCSVAAATLAADDDELIRRTIQEHVHEGCGWSYPGVPTPRRLNVVR